MYQLLSLLLIFQLSSSRLTAADNTYIGVKNIGHIIPDILEDYSQLLGQHTASVSALCWHPQNNAILTSGGQDSTICLWNVNTDRLIERIGDPDPFPWVKGLCWHPSGKALIIASDESVNIWHSKRKELLFRWIKRGNIIESIDLSAHGKDLAIGLDNAEIYMFSLQTGKTVRNFSDTSAITSSIQWHPDNIQLASGHADHYIRIWNAVAGTLLHKWLGHSQQVTCVCWSPDGTKLASGSDDKTICIWGKGADDSFGQKLHELSGHTGWIRALSWHPNGRLLASGASDKAVLIWNALNAALRAVLLGHAAGIRTLKWHKNGNLLASGSDDQDVRVWDWQRLKELNVRKTVIARLKKAEQLS